jgi:hypothetical protein
MRDLWIKTAVRVLFMMTSRDRPINQVKRLLEDYMELAKGLSRENGSRAIMVPPMLGVDEDMRRWSFFMILEHNTIVNTAITATIQHLVSGGPIRSAAKINFKTNVMPSISAGEEQLSRFHDSVDLHLKEVSTLGRLRGTKTAPHPVFGDFDAHKWNCMFAFHLKIHYGQAKYVVRATRLGQDGHPIVKR